MKHICLVTSAHLSTNPRLVKEADSLVQAGYKVSVVACRFIGWADKADQEFNSRQWSVYKIAYGPLAGCVRYFLQSGRRRICNLLYRRFGWCAELAFHAVIPELTRTACAIPADLYIAHNLAALPAASRASRLNSAKLVFDAEDFHSGEIADTPENRPLIDHTRELVSHYMPRCDAISAASPLIAKALVETFGATSPTVILNVFSRSDAPAKPANQGQLTTPSVYWFSQTIGPDRGLEEAIEAIGLSKCRPMLILRGNGSVEYMASLQQLAIHHGVADRLHCLPPAPPGDMVRLAAGYDVGLASEMSSIYNRDICLTNKIFTYLLAGLPVLASITSAQSLLASELPEAIRLFQPGNAFMLAEAIDALVLTPESLVRAKQMAWQAGQQQYNWDVEQQNFLGMIRSVLGETA